MGYARKNWKDHVVQKPRTYTEVTNPDGTKTYTPAPGEILQPGTPQSATNFNSIEEALQHCAVALDALTIFYMAMTRSYEARIKALEDQVAALAGG